MERYSIKRGKKVEEENVDKFLQEVVELSKKHGLSISHDDCYGNFVVSKYDHDDIEWILSAQVFE